VVFEIVMPSTYAWRTPGALDLGGGLTVRKPKDKARVERQVRYARRDFFGGESFRDIGETQQEAVRWSKETAGKRCHGTTRREPRSHFE
jgi:hypothetical protein